MSDNEKGAICGLVLLSFIAGMILSWIATSHVYRDHAIKAGVGYYDPQTGTFKYKIMDKNSNM